MTAYSTLISPDDLLPHLPDPDWAVVDCRFSIADPLAGRVAYRAGHIPGAVYAHLDDDLSGPVVRGRTGRHPLPDPEALAKRLSAWGVDARVQVVAYDASGGSMAARLWWLLRWLGHARVALLDGGWPAWREAGYLADTGVEARAPRAFIAKPRPEMVLSAQAVERAGADSAWRILDARAADRFRGENETIDPVAGHIPGAVSAPYAENLTPEGHFRSREDLRLRFQGKLAGVPANQVVCYCGSGVTAAHDVLAMAYAGLGEARLYPGSWSEWITDPRRQVARGADADR